MTNPIDPIPLTPAGWPYLPDNAPIADQPIYSQRLAEALDGFTPGSAATVGDTGWVGLVMLNGWLQGYSGAVRRIGAVVYLRGELYAGASGAVAFTLPAEFRPTQRSVFTTPRSGTGAVAATLMIDPATGNATPFGTVPAATPGLSLAGITYAI